VVQNIRKAEKLARKVWLAGHAAICPHLNTAHWGGDLTWEDFLLGDLAIISRCDAMLVVPGWINSKGTYTEIGFAEQNNIPVFYSLGELLNDERFEKKKQGTEE